MRTTDDFEAFEHDLREALAHLYDPTYQPSALLWEVTGGNPQQGVQSLQAALIQRIEALQPQSNVPLNARSRLIYEVLACRYLRGLTQEEAAKSVGFTSRTLRRVQQQATNLLAQLLWQDKVSDQPPAGSSPAPVEKSSPPADSDDEETVWRLQLREELAALQESSPGQIVNVNEVIRGAQEVERMLTAKHGVSLSIEVPESPLLTTTHASILRQILIRGVGKLVQYVADGQIVIRAQEQQGFICICLEASPVVTETAPYSDFIQEAAASQGGTFEVVQQGEKVGYRVKLPLAGKILVLVVDDNTDLVHFYQRYVAGTRYDIVHLADGQRLFETIAESTPDIIVLDVMLPGVDGWELLTQLHEHPDTRAIPVIVCSVIRGQDMALALGATFYLQKPIRSRQFINALEQALGGSRE